MNGEQTTQINPEVVANTIGKMTRAERRQFYLASFGKTDDGPKILFLGPKRRQRLQKIGVVHRPDLDGNHIMEMNCELTLLGEQVSRTLAERHDEYNCNKQLMRDSISLAKQRLKKSGAWEDLVQGQPHIAAKLTDVGDARLVEIYETVVGGDVVLGPHPFDVSKT